jgi:transposase
MIFLPFSSVQLEQLTVTEEGIRLHVSLPTQSGNCPDCQSSSSHVHSRYQRTLQDLPASGLSVQVRLSVRRFFCDNPSCPRKTFAQEIPEIAQRYARKTLRLIEMLRALGFALGGEQGARIAGILQIASSADTFLRLIRRSKLTAHATPTHLGVDDWGATRSCMCSCKDSRKEALTWGAAPSALPG